jgi:hypothetical protein
LLYKPITLPFASTQAVLVVFQRKEPCDSDQQWTPFGSCTSGLELELQPDAIRTAPSTADAI